MKAIMVVGTTSHAGKSLLAASICRILSRRGWRVTPFKGQNMALNSYVTSTGGEIGYAQAVQAWAAGVTPAVEMNPILLKPQGDMTSQVIMKGKVVGKVGAADYYEQYFDIGWQAITESLELLSQEFDVIICEGAGSPAEINLKHRDLTNMRVAKYLNAATILVVDIDRGGAFAHIIGTLELLEPEEKDLIQGIVINKFRGQRSLLDSGIQWLEERTKIPVIGVIPWINEAFPAEDSMSLLEQRSIKSQTEITIVIIRLTRISNFTDFDPLDAEPTVKVKYLNPDDNLGYPDAVIIPGSKTTISDLLVLQNTGMAEAIKNYQAAGGTVMGICGGFQMLGEILIDTQGLEGKRGEYEGLGLLPLKTLIAPQKIARQRQVIAHYPLDGLPILGYEIHQGRTIVTKADIVKPLFDDYDLGFVNKYQSIWGNYLHGIFDNGPWRRAWLNMLRQKRGLDGLPTGVPNYREQREVILDSITDQVNHHLDLRQILS
ncbi:MAG: cobyric acid synthase CobQ [Microcoleaceae cyanobacterium MO_207.B10]|nr:cobyric acid synthase CobQ [Microcoleaceae cyanobacterium MO_207.B10]